MARGTLLAASPARPKVTWRPPLPSPLWHLLRRGIGLRDLISLVVPQSVPLARRRPHEEGHLACPVDAGLLSTKDSARHTPASRPA